MCQLPPERLRLDVVRADPLAVQLHHGEPFAVAGLELGVAGHVHLAELEALLRLQREQLLPRPLADVAAGCVVEDELYG